jgi:hypothetical protein
MWTQQIPKLMKGPTARRMYWAHRGPHGRPVEYNPLSDIQEEAARAAILEKVMKGRQPTDLMLRCKLHFNCMLAVR